MAQLLSFHFLVRSMSQHGCDHGVEESLLQWGKPSRTHSPGDLEHLQRVIEACKLHMRGALRELMRQAEHRPLLLSYSGDGTPLGSRRCVTTKSGDSSITRNTRRSDEYYVHNLIAMYRDGMGRTHSTILMDDPRPMTAGTTAAAEITFAIEMIPNSRLHGHSGIVLQHVC